MGGFPAKLRQLLSRIEVKYLPPNPDRVVRSYVFNYEYDIPNVDDRLARQSVLTAVTLRGDSNTPTNPDDDPHHGAAPV
jgi:hypothetical protein